MYSNWFEAILKEVIQNSSDAPGCSKIEFEFITGENSTKIIAKDNGSGMSREVLENVFLVLGETTKGGTNSTGGFGVARNLICFSNDSYVIKSQNWICRGSGAMFEIEESADFVRGCIFEIETENHNWETELKELLDKCSLRQSVYINGERYSNSIHRGKMVRNLSFADVYVNKSATPGLIVRVNGLVMFHKYTPAKARIFVEINPEMSRRVLTSNRYGLQHEQSAELDGFIQEICADTKSSLRDKTKKFIHFANKNKCFLARKKVNKATPMSYTPALEGVVSKEILGGERMREFGSAIVENMRVNGANLMSENDSILTEFARFADEINPQTIECRYEPVKIDPVLESMILVNESESAEIVKVAKLYAPDVMKEGSTRFKLLKQWAKINEIILEIYTEWRGGEYGWAAGFVFSDDCEAQLRTEDSVRYILLNPIDKTGKMSYSVNNKSDIYELIVLSCHEISHMGQNCHYHNEEFSSVFTDLMKKVLGKSKEIFNAVKLVK